MGASWADQTSKKLSVWSVVFPYSMQQQQTISWSDFDVWQQVDFIWQPAMTSSMVGLRRSSKALPKAKLAPKKVMVTLWWSAAGLVLYSFLNPSETISSEKYARQTDEMHQKLQHQQQALVNRKGRFFCPATPNHTLCNQRFKSWMNWAMKFCLISHIQVLLLLLLLLRHFSRVRLCATS